MSSTTFLICDLGAKSALLALLGLGLALTRSTASWRAHTLACTLLAMAALPALRPLVPQITLPWFAAKPVTASTAPPLTFRNLAGASASPIVAHSMPTRDRISWVWALGSIGIGAYFGLGYLALRRWKRSSAPSPQQGELSDVADELAIRRRVLLLQSAACQIPVTWGWLHPIVLLPAAAQQWSPARRRQILLHELAHVRRGDWLVQLCIQIICAAYWWNPLVWLCASQWRRLCEEACDNLVLIRDVLPSEYAESLLLMTRPLNGGSMAALGIVHSSRLNRRIRSILDASARRQPLSALGRWTLSSVTILACAATAGLADTPAPTSPVFVKPIFSTKSDIRNQPPPTPIVVNVEGQHTYQAANGLVVAEGNATLTYWDAKLVRITMKADRIEYKDDKVVGKGNAVCTQGNNECAATAQTTTITLRLDTGAMEANGPHRTIILQAPDKRTDAQPAK